MSFGSLIILHIAPTWLKLEVCPNENKWGTGYQLFFCYSTTEWIQSGLPRLRAFGLLVSRKCRETFVPIRRILSPSFSCLKMSPWYNRFSAMARDKFSTGRTITSFCCVLDVSFSVKIEDSATLDELKKRIVKEKPKGFCRFRF